MKNKAQLLLIQRVNVAIAHVFIRFNIVFLEQEQAVLKLPLYKTALAFQDIPTMPPPRSIFFLVLGGREPPSCAVIPVRSFPVCLFCEENTLPICMAFP